VTDGKATLLQLDDGVDIAKWKDWKWDAGAYHLILLWTMTK